MDISEINDSHLRPLCVFVFGPQSSATRLVTKILIAAGLYGDGGHDQRLDRTPLLFKGQDIVWRRSFPHFIDQVYPDIGEMTERLPGYRFRAVVTTRDWSSMVKSQVAKRAGVETPGCAGDRIRRAYNKIITQLDALGIKWIMLSYEALVFSTGTVVEHLFDWLSIDSTWVAVRKKIKISDGNRKWRNVNLYQ